MKSVRLVLASLGRRKRTRSVFTVLVILVAFLLYGYLSAIRAAFSMGIDLAGEDRLLATHKTSIIQLLPYSYLDRISRIPGVERVTHAIWFGGIYQDKNRNFQSVFQNPCDPESYLALYPEFILQPEQKAAWLADREGAIVGRATAERYGWKIGDRVPIQGTFWRRKDGSPTWEFNIRGIYDGAKKGIDITQFLFRYDYFDEARAVGDGLVGWFILRVADPDRSPEIARAIDAEFENSPYETKTVTEKVLIQGFAKQVGDIGRIITSVLAAVFFTMVLVAVNTMAQSVRERTGELATLKTIGFTDAEVLRLVLAESCLLALVGGGAGLLLAWVLTSSGDPTDGFLPIFYIPGRDLAIGAVLVVLLGGVTGFFPAFGAMRLRIVDALRRG